MFEPDELELFESQTRPKRLSLTRAPRPRIGIITAVVSAIPVCGTPSLRAFIGRAKESLGHVEAGFTSREVCELYNNGAIARLFGRPKLSEIVYDEKTSGDDFHHDGFEAPASAGIYLFEGVSKTLTRSG